MNGVSKAYAMTGWRIGFGTGPSWLITAMIKLQSQQTSGASSISQYAALAALQGPKDFINSSKSKFKRRRDMAVEIINSTQDLKCKKPSGAFYVFVDCSGLIGKTTANGKTLKTDEDIAYAFLEEINVAVVHGSAFGLGPYLRIAYALESEALKTACHRIKHFCKSLT
jgi:aspartate aminotransferase